MQSNIINTRCKRTVYALIFVAGALFSCRPARHIPEESYLLDKYKIESSSRVKKSEIRNFVRQKPNKRILGVRFHLWLHNIANPSKDGWPHNWLRRIGEEPVVYDQFITNRSSGQIQQYLNNKGYYEAAVDDTVRFRNNRATVTYLVTPSDPTYITSVNYYFEDEKLSDIILEDSINSLVRPGNIFDVDLLQNERIRLEAYLKNEGYYNFSREHVYFNADTSYGKRSADLTLGISRYRTRDEAGQISFKSHKRYMIGDVFIYSSHNPREALNNPQEYYNDFDTLLFRNMHYFYRNKLPVSPRVIAHSNFILPNDMFNQENVDRTYRHLYALRMYRLVDIRFEEAVNQSDTLDIHRLNSWMHLTPFNMQSYTVEMEGTNSSGDFGFGGNLMYQHRNFFGGAEILDIKLSGSVETLSEYYSRTLRNAYEYGAEATLQIPRFLLPIRSVSFVRRYNPRTNLALAYNYQLRPDYNRTIAKAGFGYSWRGTQYTTHIVSPVEVNLVQLPFTTPEFDLIIRDYNLEASFRDHMVTETNYSLIFNNQDIRRREDFVYFRLNAETAGNILAAINRQAERPKRDGHYRVLGTEFAQYVKTDIDIRYYRIYSGDNSMVYRFFAGAGLPYGNSTALPFEKKYFSGGANSIRAWQVRSLGPGSFDESALIDSIGRRFPNSTADIKLEANIEYRFNLFWLMEGALFLDAGNIWAINKDDGREGALFRRDSFHNDIAVATGLGLRFDFSFFVFRVDMGMKLRDPAEPPGQKWIPLHRSPGFRDDFAINVGIGYPF
ncbi:MAG: BamA/TamA family outer membrane protein [Bacteroidales bacterium]